MLRLTLCLTFFAAGFLIGPAISAALGDQGDKGQVYTEPPQDDPNFRLMGEFVGTIKSSDQKSSDQKSKGGKTETLGLQIRVMGKDSFDALAFFGGLPGQPNHQPEPIRMLGHRSGDFVILSGGPWAIFVEQDSCLILDRTGKNLGQLNRIHRVSPTLHALPPAGATVLFDGSHTDLFSTAQMTDDGLLMHGADVKPMFQDFNLHVEFRLPYMPLVDGQQRGNSGLYLQSRYECQVLDSFAQDAVFNGCGAIYRFRKPDVNMCFPPLVWQTYDVQFTAPRWAAEGNKIRDAHITSWLNGVKVQDDIAMPAPTGHGKPEAPLLLPIKFQDHGTPVRFRNIWVVDRGLTKTPFPVSSTPAEIEAAMKAKADAVRVAEKIASKKIADAQGVANKLAAEEKKIAEKKRKQAAAEEKTAKEKTAEKGSVDNPSSEKSQPETAPGLTKEPSTE